MHAEIASFDESSDVEQPAIVSVEIKSAVSNLRFHLSVDFDVLSWSHKFLEKIACAQRKGGADFGTRYPNSFM